MRGSPRQPSSAYSRSSLLLASWLVLYAAVHRVSAKLTTITTLTADWTIGSGDAVPASELLGDRILVDAGSIPPAFSGQHASSHCSTLSARLNSAFSCHAVPVRRPSVALRLEHCLTRQPGVGAIIIQHQRRDGQPTNLPQLNTTHAAFRVRLVGPEVHLLDVFYCSEGISVAVYALSATGKYHAEVLHLYDAFHFDRPATVAPTTVFAAEFLLTVKHIWPPPLSSLHLALNSAKGGTATDLAHLDAATGEQRRAVCDLHGATHGRWVSNAALQALSFLYPTCFWHDVLYSPVKISPNMLPECNRHGSVIAPALRQAIYHVDDAVLRWQPHACDLVTFDTAAQRTRACTRDKRHLCFVGDSHTQKVANTFASQFGRTIAHRRVSADYFVDTISAGGVSVQFFWFNKLPEPGGNHSFLQQSANMSQELLKCTHLLANTGMHEISPTNPPGWATMHYVHLLNRYAARLVQLAAAGIRVWWYDSHGESLRSHHMKGMATKGLDPYFIMINSLAHSIMQQAGIPVIKTWALQATLSELKDETRHFSANGTVMHAMAQVVTHVLCHLA